MSKQIIVGFLQDDEGHFIAELACGHRQHVRHNPPWMNRPWVLTAEGRQARIGMELDCRLCEDEAGGGRPPVPKDS